MSLGKKIYAVLWAVTGGLLIALIVMFVSLNNTYGKTTPPKDGWTVKAINAKEGANYTAPVVKLKAAAAEDIKDAFGKVVVPKGTAADATVTTADALRVEAFKEYFVFEKQPVNTVATDIYDLDKWDATKTGSAKEATNATATVGALFGISLVGTIFTTVGVSVYEKRKGGRK